MNYIDVARDGAYSVLPAVSVRGPHESLRVKVSGRARVRCHWASEASAARCPAPRAAVSPRTFLVALQTA